MLTFLSVFCLSTGSLQAQEMGKNEGVNSQRFKLYVVDGKQVLVGRLDPVQILSRMPTKRQLRRGRKRLAKFTKLRWNIHRVYPYAIRISELLESIESELVYIEDEKERKEFLKSKEKLLFGQYEKPLRKLTRSQGKILMKLVFRQTGSTTYHLIKDYKNGASAFFWQSISLLFGINLKSDYDLEEDAMIETIVRELDNGGYNICYKRYNYRLP